MEARIKQLKEICDNFDDIVFGDEQDYEGGEIDALYDATGMIEKFWNRVVNGEDKSILAQDFKELKQTILLDPADYDHLTGAWVAMKVKYNGELVPVKQVLTEILEELEGKL